MLKPTPSNRRWYAFSLVAIISLVFPLLATTNAIGNDPNTKVAATEAPPTETSTATPAPEYKPVTKPKEIKVSEEPIPAQVVIQFAPETTEEERASYIESVGGTVVENIEALDTVVVSVPEEVAEEPLPESLLVNETEPDYFVSALDDLVPNDPRYEEQWALPAIGAPEAWAELPADAPKVTVAVIDSGVCASHPDLSGRILDGWDFLESDAVPQDDFGHGCSVSGIIAANMNDSIGIAGVAPNAQILPLRVLNASGVGSYSDVAAAIVYASDNGAQVINLSLGGSNPSSTLENAVNYAISKGVIVVAAAGNNGTEGALYPAAYPDVIAVGSVDPNLEPSNFSNYGSQIDIWAPGRDILSIRRDGSYGLVSGTSFAAPYVVGAKAASIDLNRGLFQRFNVLWIGDQNSENATPFVEPITTGPEGGSISTTIDNVSAQVSVGSCAIVTNTNSAGGLAVRNGPGTGYTILKRISDGTFVRITGGPSSANGLTWWQHDQGGWSAESQNGVKYLTDTSCGSNPGSIYISSDIELVSDPNHTWPPYEGDKLIGRFTLGNNGGQTLRLEGYGIRLRRNSTDYWDFLNTTARDLAPGQTVRFDQNNERPLVTGHYRAEITWKIAGQDWQVASAREFDVVSQPNPGNIYISSDIELVSDPNHTWPPYEGDKLIGRFTLGNNGGQTLRLEGYGIRLRRNSTDYWDFLNTTARDLAPGQTVRFDQNNERPLVTGHYRAEITWKIAGQDWQVASAREFDVVSQPNPGNIYISSDIELVSDPNHTWPPYEGDKLIGRFTLGNNGGQTLRLEGYGIRLRRNSTDYWDFLNTTARDLAPGQTVRFDQNNERPLVTGHYRAEITWKIAGQDWQVASAREFDVAATPSIPVDGAILANQSNGPTITPGQYFQIWFDVQNAGSSTWTSANNYYLENTNGVLLGAPSQLSIDASVPYQSIYRWNITMQAPTAIGSYTTQWRMKHNGTAFGPTLSITISVANPSSGAYDLRVTQSLSFNPSSPNVAQAVTVQYTLHNFGTQTAYLRLVGIGGRGPNGDSDIEDYPWLENISLAPNADLTISKTRGFAQGGIYTFFPVYLLSDNTWHEMNLQSGASARKVVTVLDTSTPGLQSFDIVYQNNNTKDIMPVTIRPTSYPADGSIIADVSIQNPLKIPTMMYVTLVGNISEPSGRLQKAAQMGMTIPVGSDSTVTFHNVRFYPGSQLSVVFAPFGFGSLRENTILGGYHITEILSILILGWIPNESDYKDSSWLIDTGIDQIVTAANTVNLDWFNFGRKLGEGDIEGALIDLTDLGAQYKVALSTLSGKILKTPLAADRIGTVLSDISILLHIYQFREYVRDLYLASGHGATAADITPSTRPMLAQASASSVSDLSVDPLNLAALENGATIFSASSEHISGWEQYRMIDGSASVGWGSANASPAGQWSVIRLANKTPALLSSIAINPGPIAGDPSSAAIKDFHVDASIDGVNFTTILTGTFSSAELGQMKTFQPDPVVAEYIRVVIDSNQGDQSSGIFSVAELDVRGTVYVSDDEFEPDASYVQAMPIDKDISQPHTLSFPGDEDFFRFYGQAGVTYDIATINLSNETDTVIDLYDQDGVTLLRSNDNANGLLASRVIWSALSDGYYFVRVRQQDPTKVGNSEYYSILISLLPPPLNDNFGSPTVISSVPYSIYQNAWSATTATNDPTPSCTYGINSNSVWYKYTAPANGLLEIDTWGSDYDTVLAVWTGTSGNLNQVTCNDDAYEYLLAWIEEVPVTAGTTYYIEVMDYGNPGGGNLNLFVDFASSAANDDFSSPITISSILYNNSQNVRGATKATDDPELTTCNRLPGTNSVWYQYTPTQSGLLQVDTIGSSYDTMLAVWSGSRGNLNLVRCNDDLGFITSTWDNDSALAAQLQAGTTYYIEIAGYNGKIDINSASAESLQGKPEIISALSDMPNSQDKKNAVEKGEILLFSSQEDRGDSINAQLSGGQLELHTNFYPTLANPTMYMTENNGTLRIVNQSTGATNITGNLDTNSIHALASRLGDSRFIYGVDTVEASGITSPRLAKIDTETADVTFFPAFDETVLGITNNIGTGIAISPASPNIAIISGFSMGNLQHRYYLWKINLDTGSVLGPAIPTTSWLYELTYNLDGSVLYGVDSDGQLVTVDGNTGALTLVGDPGLTTFIEGLAFRPTDGALFAIDAYDQDRLVRLDPSNGGLLQIVGNLGVRGPNGLAFAIPNSTIPTVSSINRIDTNPTNASSINFTVIFSESVTGVSTSAPFLDFQLSASGVSGADITGVSGSGSVYTVTVSTGTGSGTLRLDIPASATITDLGDNALSGLPYSSGETYNVYGYQAMSQWTSDMTYMTGGWDVNYHPRTVGDVNNDGREDLIGFGNTAVWVGLAKSSGDGFAPMTQWTSDMTYMTGGWDVNYHPRMVGDVNNDGRDDLIGFGNTAVWVALSNGTSFAPMTQWTSDMTYMTGGWDVNYHPRTVGDVNNDGRDDLIGFGNTAVWVALSNGTSFAPMTQWTSDMTYVTGGWDVKYHPRTVGDVNNDGRDDLIGFGNTAVWVALSNGTSFAPMTQWTSDMTYMTGGWDVNYHPRTVGDVNNDGREDLIGFGNTAVWVALSNGTSFAPMTQWTTDFTYMTGGWDVNYHPRTTGDINGDGKADLIGFGNTAVWVAVVK